MNLLKRKGFSDTFNVLMEFKNYKAELHEFYKEFNKISYYNSFNRIKDKLLQKNLISIKKYKGKRFIGLTNKGVNVYNKLIELNDGEITNEQYQKEEPEYWKWFLSRKVLWQRSQAETGILEGVWENINYLEEKSLINPEFQVKMPKKEIIDRKTREKKHFLDLNKMMFDVESRKKLESNKKDLELLKE